MTDEADEPTQYRADNPVELRTHLAVVEENRKANRRVLIAIIIMLAIPAGFQIRQSYENAGTIGKINTTVNCMSKAFDQVLAELKDGDPHSFRFPASC